MNKIDWRKKLASRKLWVAFTGLVTGLVVAFGGSEEAAQTISGCIMSTASVIAYIIGEGLIDCCKTDGGSVNGGGDGEN